MNKRFNFIVCIVCIVSIACIVCIHCRTYAQGSWNPPGLDPSFPRTLLDSLAVPAVRASLSAPEMLSLYSSIWASANSAIPSGNSTISDRYTRSMIAREASFAYLMDRKISDGNISTMSQDEREAILISVLGLLEQINPDVDVGTGWNFYIPWQHRSKELINYLIAYDLLRGAGVSPIQLALSKSSLLTFTANLYQKSMATYFVFLFFTEKFFTFQFNNHSIMTASALGLAAVVFNEYTSTNVNYQPQNWINAGLYNLDNTLWVENGSYPRVSEPDTLAGYAEGPNYFKYAFENAFPFIRSMWNFLPDGYYTATFNSTTRNIRNPWFDDRYDRLYDWLNKIRMPDGSFPPIHDSSMGFGTVIMALSGNPQFNLLNPAYTPDDPYVRTQYVATSVAHGPITDSLFQSLPAAGSLVFRSSWGPLAVYMHFIGKHGIALTGAKAHHQGDATSFSLAAYGELLALDPGYPGASLADLENKAIDHSLILVNGLGPSPHVWEFADEATNTAFIEHCFDTPVLDYGEVRVVYRGADIIRKNLFVRNRYFLLFDFISSSATNSYTYQLHGNGLYGSTSVASTGAFVPDFSNAQGVYARNAVSLLARVTAPGNGLIYTYESDSMAIYGGFRKYSKMLVQKNATSNALFLSTLFPYTTELPLVMPSGRNGLVTSVRIQENGFNEVAFASQNGVPHVIPADSSGLNKTVKGNGKIVFLSETSGGQFSSAFLHGGDSIISGMQTIIMTNKKMDVACMRLDTVLLNGYVSDACIAQLYAENPLQVLQGSVSGMSYDSLHHLATLTFSNKGNFILGSSDLTWTWTGQQNSDWHNPHNWQLLNHLSIIGIPASTNSVIISGAALHMPVVSSPETATCHDLIIGAGANLTVETMKLLTVTGNLTLLEFQP